MYTFSHSTGPARFSNVKIGDLICLNYYPYKPFRVVMKNKGAILLESHDNSRASRWFEANYFDYLGYVFYSTNLFYRFKEEK